MARFRGPSPPDQVIEGVRIPSTELGWRGPVFLVDDNFIGNKREAMKLLPEIAAWQREPGAIRSRLSTEASVNLSRMDKLMDIMVEGRFRHRVPGNRDTQPKGTAQDQEAAEHVSKRDDNYLFTAVRTDPGKGDAGTGRIHPGPRRR